MSDELFDWQDDLDMGSWSRWENEMSGVEEFWTTDWTILWTVIAVGMGVLAVAYFVARWAWA